MERCSGCGVMAMNHPFVGITRVANDHPFVGVTREMESGEMAAFPICGLCQRDPTHRKAGLKMHFFPREMKDIAVARAGKGDLNL